MRLLSTLAETIQLEDSPFRIQLLKEDIERLTALSDAVAEQTDADGLRSLAMSQNWTASVEQNERLEKQILALSDAVWQWRQSQSEQADGRIEQAWLALHQDRLQQMVGCLSTPLPKP